MDVDEVQRQVSKFQKISCNGSSVISDSSSNPDKFAAQNHLFGWPSSRIVRVSRASGGKDRHSKVVTSKGLRDRRIRLSVSTAIEFYDLQDRLGFDQPSKAVEWLIKAAASSIAELPDLNPSSFPDRQKSGNDADFEDPDHLTNRYHQQNNSNSNSNNNNNVSLSKSSACSSTETSKGSGLSLSRSGNRIRARERARDMAAKKEKEKETAVVGTSSFTDLLTGGITGDSNPESRVHWTTPMDYFQMPQFNIPAGDNQHHQNHHLSFLQENFPAGLNRGTLQSNLLSTLPHHHHHLQRFQPPSSMVDGSTSTNFPLFIAPTIGAPDQFPATGYESNRLQLYGGGHGHKEKSKN